MAHQHAGGLIDTTEMYLRILHDIDEDGVVPLRARIAERVGQSGPTVMETVARMQRDGLLQVGEDRRVVLSEYGRWKAITVVRKHRLVERFLADVLRLPWHEVHGEACRWEHVVSEAAERRIAGLLTPPLVSPHGNPIPGLTELGLDPPPFSPEAAAGYHPDFLARDSLTPGQVVPVPRSLNSAAASGRGRPVEVARISEWLQDDEDLLCTLRDAGVLPGHTVKAASTAAGVEVVTPAGHHEFPRLAGDFIFVRPT